MRRRGIPLLLGVFTLAAPTALAFARGGYFEGARLVALGVAGLLLLAVAVLLPRPLPTSRSALATLGGLGLLTLWTGLSIDRAPLADTAWAALERDGLYLTALVVAIAVLRHPAVRRLAEPLLAAGALVVVGYGLLGRLVPDVVHVTSSVSAGGRLDQPLTYWNAMGALAGIGVVLCARIAGDPSRATALRCAAAAGAVPLVCGLYLTFSRGSLAACAAGIVVLLAIAPTFTQLRAVAITLEAGTIGTGLAAAFPAVRTLAPDHRALEGAIVTIGLLAVMALAAAVQRWACVVEAEGRTAMGPLPLPRHRGLVAGLLVAAMLVVPVAVATRDTGASDSGERFGASAGRLATADSPRYAYWRVALEEFARHPIAGTGPGGFAVSWLRERDDAKGARDAHSLVFATLTELGLVGALGLALFAGGIAVAARDLIRRNPAVAAGPVAALAAYGFHALIDWDWEMPALTLVAVLLAGLILSRSERTSASTETAPSTTSPGSAANRNRVDP
jgi:hypothetical protein